MRFSNAIMIAAALGILCATGARADHQPALIVPSNPGVPVIIDGLDASWAVVEGDWGLFRPGHFAPIVSYPYPPTIDRWTTRAYYPVTGKRPRLGRREVIPPANRPLPPRAESFHRYWTNDGPSPEPAGAEYPLVMPPVIVAPRLK